MKTLKTTFILLAFISTICFTGTISSAADFSTLGEHAVPADADLSRVIWQAEQSGNPGFEDWNTMYQPDEITTTITGEKYTNYVTAPWPVNEGSKSFLLQARSLNPSQYSEARLTRSSWAYWSNPANLTLKLDWYLDSIGNPIDGDIFELVVYLSGPGERRIHYYFGCESSTAINGTWQGYYLIDGSLDTWNTLDRNVTADYYEIFSSYPTEFRLFDIYVRGITPELTRGLIDDIWMTNNTVVIGGATENGNFETGMAWYNDSDRDPALISRSVTRQEGEFSMNMTVLSNGYLSRARADFRPQVWLSSENPDVFSFSWNIDDLAVSSPSVYAYVYVSVSNGTHESYLYYLLTYGDFFMLPIGNSAKINATGFNSTGQWNQFTRSIYSDSFDSFGYENVFVDEIEFYIYAYEGGARTEILFDSLSLKSATLSAMSFEDQGNVGDEILAWWDNDPKAAVTGTAHTGAKAANITLGDSEYVYLSNSFGYMPIDGTTDLWLDMYWNLVEMNESADNYVVIRLYFIDYYVDEGAYLTYVMANNSALSPPDEYEQYIILDEVNMAGEWFNLRRNLYDDCASHFGSTFNGRILDITIEVVSGSGGSVEVLFDDMYLYEDPEPIIGDVLQSPLEPTSADGVNITADVYDPSIESVLVHYRVEEGSWESVAMNLVGDLYNATIPAQGQGLDVEYYIEATDAFGNIAQSIPYSYQVSMGTDPPPPSSAGVLLIVAGVAVAGVVALVAIYMFYLKPRQGAE